MDDWRPATLTIQNKDPGPRLWRSRFFSASPRPETAIPIDVQIGQPQTTVSHSDESGAALRQPRIQHTRQGDKSPMMTSATSKAAKAIRQARLASHVLGPTFAEMLHMRE